MRIFHISFGQWEYELYILSYKQSNRSLNTREKYHIVIQGANVLWKIHDLREGPFWRLACVQG